MKAQDVIQKLDLAPLPGEGGFYRETYRNPLKTLIQFEGTGQPVERSLSTQIYYMVTPETFSVLHRLKQDEIYHFYGGSFSELLLLNPKTGTSQIVKLGSDFSKGEVSQYRVPAGVWQGLRLPAQDRHGWSLVGTTCSPGFEFADFELGIREKLIQEFSSSSVLRERINLYTRGAPFET